MNERASKRIVNMMLLQQLMEAQVGETHPQSHHAAPRMRTIKEYRGLRGGSASSRPVKMPGGRRPASCRTWLTAITQVGRDVPGPTPSTFQSAHCVQSREETSGRLVKLRERKEELCLLN